MSLQNRWLRLLVGVIVIVALVVGGFAITTPAIARWGATDAEVAMPLPGDDLLPGAFSTTNAITINAPIQEVWPWIIQVGDTRGGYYSYTFIENQVSTLLGVDNYTAVYHNADQIVPEWQYPAYGEMIIQQLLAIENYTPGQSLLARSVIPGFGWTWLWYMEPGPDDTTRLIVRLRNQPDAVANAIAGTMMASGSFVMTHRMMQGIKLRAEGGFEPAWMEGAEITVWVLALLCGLISGALYLIRRNWRPGLGLASLSIVILFVLTFVMPPLWARVAIDILLVAGVWWAARPEKAAERQTAPKAVPSASHAAK